MKRSLAKFICGSAILLVAKPALAQTPALVEHAAARDIERSSDVVTDQGPQDRAGTGSGEGTGSGLRNPVFQLLTGTDETTASISIGYTLDSLVPKTSESGRYRAVSEHFLLKAAAPISKGSDRTSVFDFSGLASGDKITLGYSRYSAEVKDGGDSQKILDDARRKCVDKNAAAWLRNANRDSATPELVASNGLAFEKYRSSFNEENKKMSLSAGQNQSAAMTLAIQNLTKKGTEVTEIASYVFDQCIPSAAKESALSDDEQLIETYLSGKERIEYDESFFPGNFVTFYGVDATLAHDKFNYLDVPAFQTKSANLTSYEASLFAGVIGKGADWSLRGRYIYSKSYDANPTINVCQPISGGPQTQCLSGPNGHPVRSQTSLISIEGRAILTKGKSDGSSVVAIAPQFTYDLDAKEFAIDVPIYFVPGDDGKLSGGLRVGYRSDTKDIGAAIFVGIPFSIFY